MMGDAVKIVVHTSNCFPRGYAGHLENVSLPTLKPEDSQMSSEISVLNPVTCDTPFTPMQDATPAWQRKAVLRSSASALAQLHQSRDNISLGITVRWVGHPRRSL